MSSPTTSRTTPVLMTLSALALMASGCPQTAQTPPPKNAALTSPAPTSKAGRDGCMAASLALSSDAVVANLNGADVTASDLGAEYAAKEAAALADYCDALDALRTAALDEKVSELLVENAAKKAGMTPDAWVQKELAAAAAPVTEADARAFYDARRREDAPPFEAVREQVEGMIKQERMGEAVGALLSRLRTEANVSVTLPDVRPPAKTIEIPATSASIGPKDAAVTVVEFADFECPYCSQAAESVTTLKTTYAGRVRFVYRHFPLSFHPNARRAALYAHCANVQNKFWAFHTGAYKQQKDLTDAGLTKLSTDLGMDAAALTTCLSSADTQAAVDADMAAARALGVDGTPTFFINGRRHKGAAGVAELTASIERELAARMASGQ